MFFKQNRLNMMTVADESIVNAGKDVYWLMDHVGAPKDQLRAVVFAQMKPIWMEYFKAYCGITIRVFAFKAPQQVNQYTNDYFDMLKSRMEVATNNPLTADLREAMNHKSWYSEVNTYSKQSSAEIAETVLNKISGKLPFDSTPTINGEIINKLTVRISSLEERLIKTNFEFIE